jgi:PAS domain S-box-containing protein
VNIVPKLQKLGVALLGWLLLGGYLIYEYEEYGAGLIEHLLSQRDAAKTIYHVAIFLLPAVTTYLAHLLAQKDRLLEKLSVSEEKYRELVETANSVILTWDTEGSITFLNDFGERFFGFSRKELLGRNVVGTIVPPAESSGRDLSALMEAILRDPDRFMDNENENITKDGRRVWVRWANRAITNRQGTPVGVLSIGNDISERKLAEIALQESEEKFSKIFSQAPLLLTLSEIETGRLIEVNAKFLEVSGFNRETVIGRTVLEIGWISEEQRARMMQILHEHGCVAGMELSLRNKTGKEIICSYSGEVITLSGQPRLLSIAQDISERKMVEEVKDRLLNAISVATEGIAITDDKDRFIYVNDAHARMYGCLPDELIGKTWRDTVTPELVPLIERDLSKTLHNRAEGIWSGECPAVGKDGTILSAEITATSRWDKTGNYLGHICIVRDITERKRAEEKLRQSEEFIRSILDTVDEGFIVIDRDFRIMTANRAYCSFVGEICDSVIGRHCYEISHQKLTPCYEMGEECAVRHVFDTGEPHTALHRHPDSKGSILYVETKAFPIKDSTGAVTSVIQTVNNISEKHLLEEERLKTQKLEAIGTLAGGIAHDFNNLLQGVFGYISMARIMYDQKQKSLDMLEQAEKALHMSVNLTSQLLTFSKGGKPLKKRIALRPVIENSVKFALSGSRVDYRIKIDQELWIVEADEGQIGQVIQNLVLNAEQAMPMGGTITITSENVSFPQKGLSTLLQHGNYVVISIQDRGIGIPEQYLPKIFDPYFTTKDKGSGLGLATSYSIIKNHGGLIDAKSRLGEGATFIVYLPAVEAVEKVVATVSEDARALRKGRILLMDDEDIVRDIAGVMIRSLGHEVELAVDGKEAIEKYQESMRSDRQFDIVIMDLTVRGGMGGEEAIKELLRIDPDIKAIVSSGYTDSSAIAEYKTIGFKACLAKPYNIDLLNGTLNSLLD